MKNTKIPPTIPTIAKLYRVPFSSVFTPTAPPAPSAAIAEIAACPDNVVPDCTYVVVSTPTPDALPGSGVGSAIGTASDESPL